MKATREQRAVCARFGVDPTPVGDHEKVGISLNVKDGVVPINGLRHPPVGDTTGWYIWAGDELKPEPDFFRPLHVSHVDTWCPAVVRFLALPPGSRFLVAGEVEDVWFDPSLLIPDEPPLTRVRPPLEVLWSRELRELLRAAAVGDELSLQPSDRACAMLERLLPELLGRRYPAWEWEGLDGIFPARVTKTKETEVRILGTCILLGDETMAPFLATFEIAAHGDVLASFAVRLGEPGEGTLGISGPPCQSLGATRLLDQLSDRVDRDRVKWVFVHEATGAS